MLQLSFRYIVIAPLASSSVKSEFGTENEDSLTCAIQRLIFYPILSPTPPTFRDRVRNRLPLLFLNFEPGRQVSAA